MKRLLILFFTFSSFFIWSQGLDLELFNSAESRMNAGDYPLALEFYRRLSSEYPLSSHLPDAQFRIGQCLYNMGEDEGALVQMKRVAERFSMTGYSRYIPFWEGILSYRMELNPEAEVRLGEYIKNGSNQKGSDGYFKDVYRKDAYLYRALSLKELGREDEALDILGELYRLVPYPEEEPYLLTLLGEFYLKQGRLSELSDILLPLNLSSIQPPWREHLSFFKAELMTLSGDTDEAIALYIMLSGTGSAVAGPSYQRIFSIYQERNEKELLESLIGRAEVELRDNPGVLAEFWLRAGIGFFKSGDREQAEFYLKKVWNSAPPGELSPLTPLYLAMIAAEEDNYSRALEYIDSYLLDSDEKRERLLYTRGELLSRSEKWTEADFLWNEFFSEYPQSPLISPASYYAGYTAYRMKKYPSALEYLGRVNISDLTGEQRQGLDRLNARLWGWTGDYIQADVQWDGYLAVFSQDWTARGEALKIKFLSGDYDGVIGSALVLKRRGDTDEDRALSVLAYYLSGLSFLAKDDYTRALEDFLPLTQNQLEAAGIKDVYPFILYYRGWAQYRSGEYIRALRDFRELTGILSEESESLTPYETLLSRALYLAGWCAYQLEDYSAATDFFSTYSMTDDQPEQGLLMHARALAGSGRKDEAVNLLEEGLSASRNTTVGDDTLFELAGQLFEIGRTEASMERYLELYELYPESILAEESLYQRGEKYLTLNQWTLAQDAFYQCRKAYPSGALTAAAHFWGGEAARLGGEDFGAVLLWKRLMEQYPDSPFRALAIRKTADIYMARGDYIEAMDYYRELSSSYPRQAGNSDVISSIETLRFLLLGESEEVASLRAEISTFGGLESPESREAMLELARILLYRGGEEQEEGKLLLEDLVFYIEEDLFRAARAQYYLGEFYFRQNEYVMAGEAYLAAAAMNPGDTDLMSMSIFRAAETALLRRDFTSARKLVQRLEENFPDSTWAQEGRKLLEEEE